MINIIAAIGENRELGKDNKLLWHIPEDMKFFRTITKGHPVIMGRKTFESIGSPLPNRTNIIITRDENLKIEGTVIAHSLDEAISHAKSLDTGEVFIIGGAQIYEQALAFANKLYLTIVHDTFDADVFFPEYEDRFSEVESKDSSDENYSYTFTTLQRK